MASITRTHQLERERGLSDLTRTTDENHFLDEVRLDGIVEVTVGTL